MAVLEIKKVPGGEAIVATDKNGVKFVVSDTLTRPELEALLEHCTKGNHLFNPEGEHGKAEIVTKSRYPYWTNNPRMEEISNGIY